MKFIIINSSPGITINTKIYSTINKDIPYTYRYNNDTNDRFIDDEGDIRPLSAFSIKIVKTVDWLNT